MAAAFGVAPTLKEVQAFQHAVTEPLPLTPSVAAANPTDLYVHETRVQRGDTVDSLLSRLGVTDDSTLDFFHDARDANAIARQLIPGKAVTAHVNAQGNLERLVFPLSGGKDRAVVVERQSTGYAASEQSLPVETQVLMKSAEIRYSLFGATDAAGIPDAVAMQLIDIFGGDIDFHRDLRKGDRFSVVYESINHLGRSVRTGRILAAEFENNGRTYRAVWFQATGDQGGYYDTQGKSLRKAFLRSPLEFSRITSQFSNARFHPVLQEWRAHKGIDYGAAIGTRIKATADGVVEFQGTQGGYGKVVILRHQSSYTTLYGHLSGFAAGIRKGARVAQGDIIGFVGVSGLATGPHLHYEFRINGIHQNPLAIALPSAPPLGSSQMTEFREITRAQMARIDMMRGTNLALLD